MSAVTLHHDTGKNHKRIGVFMAGIWFIYLVLKPVYLFPVGMPQISDAILAFGILPACVIMFMECRNSVSLVTITGGMFAAMTVAINLLNYIFYPDRMFLLSSLYYPYNFLIFLFAVFLFRQDGELMIRLSVLGIFISLFLQFVTSEFFPDYDMGERLTGGFKNPNQLAYWSLLSAAMLVFLRRGQKFGVMELFAIALAAFLQTLALSKTGIITFSLFLSLLVFAPQISHGVKIALVFLMLLAGSYLAFAPEQLQRLEARMDAVERVSQRIGNIGFERDDTLEGRGYNRIIESPEYLLVGAGEGGYNRFRTAGSPAELHSGLATILFSYGVMGLLLFSVFLLLIFYRQPPYYIAILLTVMLFGATSQTVRFTHTWVFFGIAYGTYLVRREEERAEQAVPAESPALQRL